MLPRWTILASILVGLVAALHLAFLVLEMFLWTTPTGRTVFGLDREFAQASKVLAANQGLYNGFLAAGLVWGLASSQTDVTVFFLLCVVVAGSTEAPPSIRGSSSCRRCRPRWRCSPWRSPDLVQTAKAGADPSRCDFSPWCVQTTEGPSGLDQWGPAHQTPRKGEYSGRCRGAPR